MSIVSQILPRNFAGNGWPSGATTVVSAKLDFSSWASTATWAAVRQPGICRRLDRMAGRVAAWRSWARELLSFPK